MVVRQAKTSWKKTRDRSVPNASTFMAIQENRENQVQNQN